MKTPPPAATVHYLKKTLSLAVLFGSLTLVQAQILTPTVIYQEDFGALYTSTNAVNAGTMQSIGWTASGGQYTGTYTQGGTSFDVVSGITLSNRPCYFSSSIGSDAGIIYTTDGAGSGTNGTAAFSSIDPAASPGLKLSVYSQTSSQNNVLGQVSNYFAVQVGGNWYVSTAPLTNTLTSGNTFALSSLVYNNAAGNWNNLTILGGGNPGITIGGPAGAIPGVITGIGIVQVFAATLTGTPGFNYQNLTITKTFAGSGAGVAPVINGTGRSQTNYVGAGVSFTVNASIGTMPFTFSWHHDGGATLVDGPTGNGSTIFGATTSQITISNIQPADVGVYSVVVANGTGSDTDLNYVTNYLEVLTPGPELLYQEVFPFIGPLSPGESLPSVGWKATIPAARSPNRVDERGDTYAYENAGRTVAYYTGTNIDIGQSGSPFPPGGITPGNYPFVSFRATYGAINTGGAAPGNAGVFFAVEMAGGQWFVSRSANLLAGAPGATTNSYGLQFATDNTQWNTLTLGATTATVGGMAAPGALNGKIFGVGLVLVYTGPSLYEITSVSLVTNSTPPVAPSFPSLPNVPYPQTVYAGGGGSFSFTEAGTPPFTNHWDFNQSGIFLTDGTTASGSIISGSETTMLTIQNVSQADAGGYRGVVSNPGGVNTTDTGTFGVTPLTVNDPPLGFIYSEAFPAYVRYGANNNQPLSIVGWRNQSDAPNRLFQLTGPAYDQGLMAGFAYQGGTTNSLFYGSVESDTGASGLPFIAFDPAYYPAGSLQFSAAFSGGNAQYTNVSASFAVRINGNWYMYATPVLPTFGPITLNGPYVPFSQTNSFAAGQWINVTLAGTSGVILGAPTTQPLTGTITAAGLLFQHTFVVTVPPNFGGSVNWNSFAIQAVGNSGDNVIGGLNINPNSDGTVTLTWIGNPQVKLQSTSSLNTPITWTDVPNTLGFHSKTVSATGGPQFFQLTGPAVP